jgi:hypothetical protein
MTSHQVDRATDHSRGTVVGAPRAWLQMEACTLMIGSLVVFSTTHRPWWLVPLMILCPDLLMVGYVAGSRIGANVYNVAHATPLPMLLVGLAWWTRSSLWLAIGAIWLAHIGMDRVFGFGLKYNDHFQHTHLSTVKENKQHSRRKS